MLNRFSRPLISWAFYDFANTIFSAVVLTFAFPLYFTQLTGANWILGTLNTSTMLVSGLLVPFWGAVCDQEGAAKKYLIWTTGLCLLFLAGLGIFRNPFSLMIAFALSAFFYQASLVFYNALLPVVAPPNLHGWASGLGTGLGYLGVVLVMPLVRLTDEHFGMPSAFLLAAGLFFVFSLPLFFWVPEYVPPAPSRPSLAHTWRGLREVLKICSQSRKKLFFYLGNFFLVDAVNSMIFWFIVFGREVFHPKISALIGLMVAVNVCAFFWGLAAGWLTDRIGSLKTLLLAGAALMTSLTVLALSPRFSVFGWAAATGGAFSIAAIWTAGRKAVMDIAEPEHLGAHMGLYSMTTKVSVAGSFIFSVMADLAGFRWALSALIVPTLIGTFFILRAQNK